MNEWKDKTGKGAGPLLGGLGGLVAVSGGVLGGWLELSVRIPPLGPLWGPSSGALGSSWASLGLSWGSRSDRGDDSEAVVSC